MRNPRKALTERDFVEEALKELTSDPSCTFVHAMTTASSRLEDRVARTNYVLRTSNTETFVRTMIKIGEATGVNIGLAFWDERPGRTHTERVALLEKLLKEL